MISVYCEYINVPNKVGDDYFIYTKVEVTGHSNANGMNHTTGIKVCAGVSACCNGIKNLIDTNKYHIEIGSGNFKVYTNREIKNRSKLKSSLCKDSVYALNTLIFQLYEIYKDYPSAFKTFNLVDIKEYDDYE